MQNIDFAQQLRIGTATPDVLNDTLQKLVVASQGISEEIDGLAARAAAWDAKAAHAAASSPSVPERLRDGWLWAAACLGSAGAGRTIADRIDELAANAPEYERPVLAALATDWRCRDRRRGLSALVSVSDEEFPEEHDFVPEIPGAVVIPEIGDAGSKEGKELALRFSSVVGRSIPYAGRVPAPGEVKAKVLARWPWAEVAAHRLETHFSVLRLSGSPVVRLPRLLFVGRKGSGKTSLARFLCDELGIPRTLVPCGGVSDAAGISPVTRAWSTTRPGAAAQAMISHKVANPTLILDEIDKTTAAGSHNGSVSASLLSLVGETRFYDSCLMTEVDVSAMGYVATANSLTTVDEALRDRFTVVEVPSPGPEHLPVLLETFARDFAATNGITPSRLPSLTRSDKAVLLRWFETHGRSARALYDCYGAIVANHVADRERLFEEARPGEWAQ